jgi:hypothetical protein
VERAVSPHGHSAERRFVWRGLAFIWLARAQAGPRNADDVLDAATHHLQQRHARIEPAAVDRALEFGSGSGARRSWLGAIRGGRFSVTESASDVQVTVQAGVARLLLICALPAVLMGVLGAWPFGLLFALAGAANLWFVDRGARQLIDAALAGYPTR